MPALKYRAAALLLCALGAAVFDPVHAAEDWQDVVFISSTVGNHTNRLCMGVPDDKRPSDIGCPSYAPSLSTAGHVSISGNVSANKFIGDGSGLTNLTVQGDRITSDTHAAIINQNTGYVSLTTAGGTWGYFSAGWSYLANLFTDTVSSSLVSATNVSATYVDVTRNGTVSGTYGYFRYISGTDISGRFTGDGSGLSGVIAGSSDRIVSGSTGGTRMVAISETGYISITQAGANSAWFDPYRGLLTLGVSATGGISGTSGYFSGNVGIGTGQPRATLQVSGSFAVSSTLTNTYPTFYAGTNGRVGINTMNPLTSLHSLGTIMAEGAPIRISNTNTQHIRFEGGFGPSWRLISTINGATPGRIVMQYSGDGFASDFANGLVVYPSGTVSITSAIQIGTAAALACDLNLAGTIRYFTGHVLQYCNGTAWTTLGAAGGGQEDRIVSGTTKVIANQNASVTIATNGSQRVIVGSNGRVGVGTQTPAVAFHVMGGIMAEGGILRVSNSATQQFRYENGTGLAWRTISTINGNTPGGLVVQYSSDDYTSDFVNAATFQVGGTVSFTNAIQVGTSSLTCSAGISGAIRYSSGSLQYCDGSAWTTLGTGAGSVGGTGSPTAVAFWSTSSTLSYSDGFYWNNVNKRLGIGTNIPDWPLHISTTFPIIELDRAASGASNGGLFWSENGSERWKVVSYNGAYAQPDLRNAMAFLQAADRNGNALNLYRLTINDSGNVGINTASQTATLQVSGTFTVSRTGQNTSPSLYVASSNGWVGVGTSDPSSMLTVEAVQPSAASGHAQIYVNTPNNNNGTGIALRTTTTGSERVWSILAGTGGGSPNHNLRFYDVTGAAERMNLTTGGGVGIGTATPAISLTVIGEVQVSNSGVACDSATRGGIRYTHGTGMQYCNGSVWSAIGGGDAPGDRITSGTLPHAMVINSATGYINLTTSPTTWGYLSSANSYLPTLSSTRVSATAISTTIVELISRSVGSLAGSGANFIASGTTSVSVSSAGYVTMGVNSGNRPISFRPGFGDISTKADTGGWTWRYGAIGSGGTDQGGFGFFGSADALIWYYIGPSYSSPFVAVTSGGYVGLGGITAPGYRLELPNTASVAGRGRANQWATYSDGRFKTDRKPIDNALEKVMQLNGITYRSSLSDSAGLEIGYIAQAVEQVVPEVVSIASTSITLPDGTTKVVPDYRSMDYARLVPVLSEAIKELKAANDNNDQMLRAEIDDLRRELRELKQALQ